MTVKNYALPSAETIIQTQLDNGIAVYVYENPSVESVVIYGSVAAGSIYEDLTRNGVASMTAAALMRGTQRRDFETLNGILEDIGAEFDYSTGKYRVTFSGRSLAEDFETLFDVFADSLCHPRFDGDELDEERSKRITELNYAYQDTRYMAAQGFRKELYPDTHAFHYSTYGSVDSLPSITQEDLRAFHETYYQPNEMIIVIVGAIQSQDAIATVEKYLGDWGNNQAIKVPQLADILIPAETTFVETALVGKSQADIVMGLVGPSRFAEDYIAAQLANSILGEFGMMGRVGDVIREQLGLAYYAYSRMDGGAGPGAWTIAAGVAPENVELAIEKARDEIALIITELVSVEDLDDNQAYFTGRLPLRLESNYGLASTIHAMTEYDLGMDYLLQYHDVVFRITREDVLSAARHYLHPDRLVISVAH